MNAGFLPIKFPFTFIREFADRHRLYVRIASTSLAIAIANFLLDFPRVVSIMWQTQASALPDLGMVVFGTAFLEALTISVCIELYDWQRKPPTNRTKRVIAVLCIASTPLLLFIACWLSPVPYAAAFESGITASWTDLTLYTIWDLLVFGSVAVTYLTRRRRAHEQEARGKRIAFEWQEARRMVLETRMQALQARVEPQLLFDSLGALPRLYATGRDAGENLVATLTEFLRVSLPRGSTETTVSEDIEHLRAYVELLKAAGLAHLTLTSTLSDETGAIVLPAGLLYPLAAHWMRAANGSDTLFEVEAYRVANRTHIVVTGPRHDIQAAKEKVASDLRALYDTGSEVSIISIADRISCHMEYDHDFSPVSTEIV